VCFLSWIFVLKGKLFWLLEGCQFLFCRFGKLLCFFFVSVKGIDKTFSSGFSAGLHNPIY